MNRTGGARVKPGPGLRVILGAPVSVFLGLVLAVVALWVSVLYEGGYSEFGYCSEHGGIGTYGTVVPDRVLGLLLAPTAIWAAAALGTGFKRRREWRWYAEQS